MTLLPRMFVKAPMGSLMQGELASAAAIIFCISSWPYIPRGDQNRDLVFIILTWLTFARNMMSYPNKLPLIQRQAREDGRFWAEILVGLTDTLNIGRRGDLRFCARYSAHTTFFRAPNFSLSRIERSVFFQGPSSSSVKLNVRAWHVGVPVFEEYQLKNFSIPIS